MMMVLISILREVIIVPSILIIKSNHKSWFLMVSPITNLIICPLNSDNFNLVRRVLWTNNQVQVRNLIKTTQIKK